MSKDIRRARKSALGASKKATIKKETPKVYYIHVNRQKIQKQEEIIWTIQGSKGCTSAREVKLRVPSQTVYRPQGKQPRAQVRCVGVLSDLGDGRYMIS